MIEIRLNFKSPEEAIVFLARMNGGATAKAANTKPIAGVPVASEPGGAGVTSVTPALSAAPATPAPTSTRKPRADKGQKREPYGPREQNAGVAPSEGSVIASGGDAGSTPASAVPQPAPDQRGPQGSDSSESGRTAESVTTVKVDPLQTSATTVASEADAQAALEAIYKAKGLPAAQAVMAGFGVQRLRDLPAEKRGEFITKATEAAK